VGARLTAVELITIIESHAGSTRNSNLRRRPIGGDEEGVPVGSTDITRILEKLKARHKPITRIKSTRNQLIIKNRKVFTCNITMN
jgi:hypothetical protein